MKLKEILLLLTLIAVVNGALLAAVAQPVILGLGVAFAAIDLDVLNVHFKISDWNPFGRKARKKKELEEHIQRCKDLIIEAVTEGDEDNVIDPNYDPDSELWTKEMRDA